MESDLDGAEPVALEGMSIERRRVIQHRFGDPASVLKVEALPPLVPLNAGQVRVRVSRAGIHPGDLQLVAGSYGGAGDAIPAGRVPGTEGAGVVMEVNPDATGGGRLQAGDRVAFFASAAWQSVVTVPAEAVVAIPDEVSDDVAAQVLTNTITARHVLRAGIAALGAKPAHLVQTGASSSTGRLITAFALEAGIDPVRLVRSKPSAERLADLLPGGEIVDTSAPGWPDRVLARCEGGVPLVLDAVGGPMIADALRVISHRGTLISYGRLGGGPTDLMGLLVNRAPLRGARLATGRADRPAEARAADCAAAGQGARDHPALFASPPPFALADLRPAIAAAGGPATAGNVLLAF